MEQGSTDSKRERGREGGREGEEREREQGRKRILREDRRHRRVSAEDRQA